MKMYGYKKCSTCRKVENYLQEKGFEYEYIDIIENPPGTKELKSIIKKSGKELKSFYNTSGIQYRELNIKEKREELSESEQIKLLSGNGRLLKRPIVVDSKKSSVGRQGIEKVWE